MWKTSLTSFKVKVVARIISTITIRRTKTIRSMTSILAVKPTPSLFIIIPRCRWADRDTGNRATNGQINISIELTDKALRGPFWIKAHLH